MPGSPIERSHIDHARSGQRVARWRETGSVPITTLVVGDVLDTAVTTGMKGVDRVRCPVVITYR